MVAGGEQWSMVCKDRRDACMLALGLRHLGLVMVMMVGMEIVMVMVMMGMVIVMVMAMAIVKDGDAMVMAMMMVMMMVTGAWVYVLMYYAYGTVHAVSRTQTPWVSNGMTMVMGPYTPTHALSIEKGAKALTPRTRAGWMWNVFRLRLVTRARELRKPKFTVSGEW